MHYSGAVHTIAGTGNQATFSGTGFRHDIDGYDQVAGRGLDVSDVVNLTAIDFVLSRLGS